VTRLLILVLLLLSAACGDGDRRVFTTPTSVVVECQDTNTINTTVDCSNRDNPITTTNTNQE